MLAGSLKQCHSARRHHHRRVRRWATPPQTLGWHPLAPPPNLGMAAKRAGTVPSSPRACRPARCRSRFQVHASPTIAVTVSLMGVGCAAATADAAAAAARPTKPPIVPRWVPRTRTAAAASTAIPPPTLRRAPLSPLVQNSSSSNRCPRGTALTPTHLPLAAGVATETSSLKTGADTTTFDEVLAATTSGDSRERRPHGS